MRAQPQAFQAAWWRWLRRRAGEIAAMRFVTASTASWLARRLSITCRALAVAPAQPSVLIHAVIAMPVTVTTRYDGETTASCAAGEGTMNCFFTTRHMVVVGAAPATACRRHAVA